MATVVARVRNEAPRRRPRHGACEFDRMPLRASREGARRTQDRRPARADRPQPPVSEGALEG